jgi:hypothetical protein
MRFYLEISQKADIMVSLSNHTQDKNQFSDSPYQRGGHAQSGME